METKSQAAQFLPHRTAAKAQNDHRHSEESSVSSEHSWMRTFLSKTQVQTFFIFSKVLPLSLSST